MWNFLLQVMIEQNLMLKILKNGKKVTFRIKGSNSAYIMNDKLKRISKLKVSKGSECV